jgi:hypothetical protein
MLTVLPKLVLVSHFKYEVQVYEFDGLKYQLIPATTPIKFPLYIKEVNINFIKGLSYLYYDHDHQVKVGTSSENFKSLSRRCNLKLVIGEDLVIEDLDYVCLHKYNEEKRTVLMLNIISRLKIDWIVRFGDNSLLFLNKNLRYRVVKIENSKFVPPEINYLDRLWYPLQPKIEDLLVLRDECEIILFFSNKLAIFNYPFKLIQEISVPHKNGTLKKINDNSFLLFNNSLMNIYLRSCDKEKEWSLLQCIGYSDTKPWMVEILAPSQTDFIRTSSNLPVDLPVVLKVEVIKFLY